LFCTRLCGEGGGVIRDGICGCTRLKLRDQNSEYLATCVQICSRMEKNFMGFFRMNIEQFYCLSQLVGEEIRKQNTKYRRAILPEERLAIFLIILEPHLFLISALGSIMIYSYLPLFLQFYIRVWSSLCIFCSIRIVMDI